jgi:hypothetical protein
VTTYPEPLEAEDTTTSAFIAERVPVIFAVLPTVTFPKFSVDGEIASVAAASPEFWFCFWEPEDIPAQLVSTNIVANAKMAATARGFDSPSIGRLSMASLNTVERANRHVYSRNRDRPLVTNCLSPRLHLKLARFAMQAHTVWTRRTIPACSRGTTTKGCRPSLWGWNYRGSLVGIRAFLATSIYSLRYIVIGLSICNRRIREGSRRFWHGPYFGIGPPRRGASIDLV